MNLVLHPLAQKEFERKILYLHRKGLMFNSAELFIDEIDTGFLEIKLNPKKYKLRGNPDYYRFGPTQRFSYSIIYQINEGTIEIMAISAPERRPDYWKRRRPESE